MSSLAAAVASFAFGGFRTIARKMARLWYRKSVQVEKKIKTFSAPDLLKCPHITEAAKIIHIERMQGRGERGDIRLQL